MDLATVLQLAIDKEQESVDFYTSLAERTQERTLKERMLELAKVEEQHRTSLSTAAMRTWAASVEGSNAPLSAEERGAIPTGMRTGELTWEKLVDIAIEREIASAKLYTDFARIARNAEIKRILRSLAADEQGHRKMLESLRK